MIARRFRATPLDIRHHRIHRVRDRRQRRHVALRLLHRGQHTSSQTGGVRRLFHEISPVQTVSLDLLHIGCPRRSYCAVKLSASHRHHDDVMAKTVPAIFQTISAGNRFDSSSPYYPGTFRAVPAGDHLAAERRRNSPASSDLVKSRLWDHGVAIGWGSMPVDAGSAVRRRRDSFPNKRRRRPASPQ